MNLYDPSVVMRALAKIFVRANLSMGGIQKVEALLARE
jgi:hypothetical protein